VLKLIAEFYVRLGFSQKSLDYARRAVSAYPNSVPARKILATGLQSIGKLEEAAKELLAAIERDPPQRFRYQLHFQLARLYYSGLEEFANAKEHYEAAREHAVNRSAARRAKKKLKEVEKRIEHQRKVREGELPEGAKPPGPGGGHGPGPGPMPKDGPPQK
jgi:tetratricopeptide (TPR) repeat protein